MANNGKLWRKHEEIFENCGKYGEHIGQIVEKPRYHIVDCEFLNGDRRK
jgi:hypothetical protein